MRTWSLRKDPKSLEPPSLVAVGCQQEGKTYSSFRSVFPGRRCRVRGHIPPNSTWPLQVTQAEQTGPFKGPKEERPSRQFSSWQPGPGPVPYKARALWSGHGEWRPAEPSCLGAAYLAFKVEVTASFRVIGFPIAPREGTGPPHPPLCSAAPQGRRSVYTEALPSPATEGQRVRLLTSGFFVLVDRP